MVLFDPDLRVRHLVGPVQRVLGVSPDELIGTGAIDRLHPDDLEAVADQVGEMLATGEPVTAQARFLHGDGTYRWLEGSCVNLLNHPQIAGLAATFRDVSDRTLAEAARRESEERFRALVQHASDVVEVIDAHGVIRYISPAVERLMGYSPDQLIGTPALALVHPDDQDHATEALVRAFEFDENAEPEPEQQPEVVEVRVLRRDGEWRWIEVVGSNQLDNPAVGGVVINFRDITERKQATDALAQSEALFRALVHNSRDVILLIDADATITYASPSARDRFGWEPEELVGRNGIDLVHPDDVALAVERLAEVRERGQSDNDMLLRIRDRDGAWRWIEAAGTNLLAVDGIGAMMLNVRDVTERQAGEAALRASEARFRSLAASSPTGIFETDADHRCTYVNERWQVISGRPAGDALGYGWASILHPDDLARLQDQPGDGTEAAMREDLLRFVRPNGETRWVATRAAPVTDDAGNLTGFVGTADDVTDTIEAARESDRLTSIIEATTDAIGLVDGSGRTLYVNGAGRTLCGIPADLPAEEIALVERYPDWARRRFYEEALPVLNEGRAWHGEMAVRGADGEEVPISQVILTKRDANGQVEYFATISRDISERKQMEATLEHQATHDPLTGLPNRALLLDRLGLALERARQNRLPLALLFVDVDNFKVVNDSLGHDRGDRILGELSDRLSERLRRFDTVARFGGDEFVVLCEDLQDDDEALAVAERLRQATAEPFGIDGVEIFVTLSIGIAYAGRGDARADALVRDADAAMYAAKERGRDRFEVFDTTMRARLQERLETESALRRALERNELVLHYQPTVALYDGAIAGVEALVRWQHPERGLLAPAEFIPIAEESGLIVPIGEWVLEEACRQLVAWRSSVPAADELVVSVNLSGRQLADPALPSAVASILDRTGADPAWVQLELTESVLMSDPDTVVRTLETLRSTGVTLAVDDFGTGYSSLAYLKRFPTQILKIDRAFIAGVGQSLEDSTITAAVIRLAHTLGRQAVAEGVEEEEQLVKLRASGCDLAQGFYFSGPLPAAELETLLQSEPRW